MVPRGPGGCGEPVAQVGSADHWDMREKTGRRGMTVRRGREENRELRPLATGRPRGQGGTWHARQTWPAWTAGDRRQRRRAWSAGPGRQASQGRIMQRNGIAKRGVSLLRGVARGVAQLLLFRFVSHRGHWAADVCWEQRGICSELQIQHSLSAAVVLIEKLLGTLRCTQFQFRECKSTKPEMVPFRRNVSDWEHAGQLGRDTGR